MLTLPIGEGKDLFIEPQTECSVHCSDSPSAKSPMSVNSPSVLKVWPPEHQHELKGSMFNLGTGLPDHWIGLQGRALKIESKLTNSRDFRNLTRPQKSLRSTASRWEVEYSEEKNQIREKIRHTWKGSQLLNVMWKCFLTVTAWELTNSARNNRERVREREREREGEREKDLRARTTVMIRQEEVISSWSFLFIGWL